MNTSIFTVFDQADSAILLTSFSFLLPFVYAWMKSNILPDWVKFIIVVIVCGVGGWLTAMTAGQFVGSASIVQNGSIVAIAGLAIYDRVFKSLGLEQAIFPRASLVTAAQASVASQIGTLSTQTVKDAVSANTNTTILVTAERREDPTAMTSVIPKG